MRLGLSRSRKISGGIKLLILFIISIILFIALLIRLQPAFYEYAAVYANNAANSVVNDAINEVFTNSSYSDLVKQTQDDSGLRAIETDTIKINKLKAALNESIQNSIKNSSAQTVYIPLGSVTNCYFLAGLGPKIPIRIYPVSVVNTDFNDEFVSAGINQVNHKIYLDVSLEMSFIGFGFSHKETVETSALLSETVIIGDTPEYYGGGNFTASMQKGTD